MFWDDERALPERAKIARFWAEFESYKKQCQEKDQGQVIGRHYDWEFDFNGDLSRQVNEKLEQLDRELEEERSALEIQDLQERKAFDEWITDWRLIHKERDAGEMLYYYGAYDEPSEQRPHEEVLEIISASNVELAGRERLRDEEESKIRREFTGQFQEPRHDKRLEVLRESDAVNRARLSKIEEYLQPMPWESEGEAHTRAVRAIQGMQERERQQRQQQIRPRNLTL